MYCGNIGGIIQGSTPWAGSNLEWLITNNKAQPQPWALYSLVKSSPVFYRYRYVWIRGTVGPRYNTVVGSHRIRPCYEPNCVISNHVQYQHVFGFKRLVWVCVYIKMGAKMHDTVTVFKQYILNEKTKFAVVSKIADIIYYFNQRTMHWYIHVSNLYIPVHV